MQGVLSATIAAIATVIVAITVRRTTLETTQATTQAASNAEALKGITDLTKDVRDARNQRDAAIATRDEEHDKRVQAERERDLALDRLHALTERRRKPN